MAPSAPLPCAFHERTQQDIRDLTKRVVANEEDARDDRALASARHSELVQRTTVLETKLDLNSSAIRTYVWPLLVILLTAIGTYVSGRIGASHPAPAEHSIQVTK